MIVGGTKINLGECARLSSRSEFIERMKSSVIFPDENWLPSYVVYRGSTVPVMITCFKDLFDFTCQLLCDDDSSFLRMMEQLNEHCTMQNDGSGRMVAGRLCAVKHPIDETWYRARLMRVIEDRRRVQLKVRLVDYGDVLFLESPSDIRVLNNVFCSEPERAVRCCLRHLIPTSSNWTTAKGCWARGLMAQLRNLFVGTENVRVSFVDKLSQDTYLVDVFIGDKNMAEVLKDHGVAQFVSPADQLNFVKETGLYATDVVKLDPDFKHLETPQSYNLVFNRYAARTDLFNNLSNMNDVENAPDLSAKFHAFTLNGNTTPETDQREDTMQQKTVQEEVTVQQKTVQRKESVQQVTVQKEGCVQQKTVQREKNLQYFEIFQEEETIQQQETVKLDDTVQQEGSVQQEEIVQREETVPKEETCQQKETAQQEETERREEIVQKEETRKQEKNIRQGCVRGEVTVHKDETICQTVQREQSLQEKVTVQLDDTVQQGGIILQKETVYQTNISQFEMIIQQENAQQEENMICEARNDGESSDDLKLTYSNYNVSIVPSIIDHSHSVYNNLTNCTESLAVEMNDSATDTLGDIEMGYQSLKDSSNCFLMDRIVDKSICPFMPAYSTRWFQGGICDADFIMERIISIVCLLDTCTELVSSSSRLASVKLEEQLGISYSAGLLLQNDVPRNVTNIHQTDDPNNIDTSVVNISIDNRLGPGNGIGSDEMDDGIGDCNSANNSSHQNDDEANIVGLSSNYIVRNDGIVLEHNQENDQTDRTHTEEHHREPRQIMASEPLLDEVFVVVTHIDETNPIYFYGHVFTDSNQYETTVSDMIDQSDHFVNVNSKKKLTCLPILSVSEIKAAVHSNAPESIFITVDENDEPMRIRHLEDDCFQFIDYGDKKMISQPTPFAMYDAKYGQPVKPMAKLLRLCGIDVVLDDMLPKFKQFAADYRVMKAKFPTTVQYTQSEIGQWTARQAVPVLLVDHRRLAPVNHYHALIGSTCQVSPMINRDPRLPIDCSQLGHIDVDMVARMQSAARPIINRQDILNKRVQIMTARASCNVDIPPPGAWIPAQIMNIRSNDGVMFVSFPFGTSCHNFRDYEVLSSIAETEMNVRRFTEYMTKNIQINQLVQVDKSVSLGEMVLVLIELYDNPSKDDYVLTRGMVVDYCDRDLHHHLEFKVYFIDYGHELIVSQDKVFAIPHQYVTALPSQALQIKLMGRRSRHLDHEILKDRLLKQFVFIAAVQDSNDVEVVVYSFSLGRHVFLSELEWMQ